MQVYDLAWSPTGEYIIAGSTDNTARVFAAVDGKCVYEIAEHSHYVQSSFHLSLTVLVRYRSLACI